MSKHLRLSLILILIVFVSSTMAGTLSSDLDYHKAKKSGGLDNMRTAPFEKWQVTGTPINENEKDKPLIEERSERNEVDEDRPIIIFNSNPDVISLDNIKADGVISPKEKAEYQEILDKYAGDSGLPPVINSVVYESEPNDDCASANAVASGDTIWCAAIESSGAEDYFTFTLDATYTTWDVTIETYGCDDNSTPLSDSRLYLYNDTGCSNQIGFDDDNGVGFYAKIRAIDLVPGNYTFKVTGYDDAIGDYHVSILCSEAAGPPANDNCSGVESISGPYPVTVEGTTIGATVSCPAWGSYIDTWYAIQLPYPSNDIEISFCGTDAVIPSIGGVFMPGSCYCGYPTWFENTYWDCADDHGSPRMTSTFLAGPAVIYFPTIIGGQFDFTMTVNVTESAAPPINDLCDGRIVLSVPSSTVGTTIGATGDGDYEVCGSYSYTEPPGVWYSVIGTGNEITLSMCNEFNTGFNMGTLNVYCYSCDPAVCVGGGEYDYCPYAVNKPSITWCTEAGEEYLILVNLYGEMADFQIDVSEGSTCSEPPECGEPDPPPANNDCANATIITGPYPVSGTGTNIRATNDCPLTQGNEVWYAFELPYAYNDVVISVCSDEDLHYCTEPYGMLMDDCNCDNYIEVYFTDDYYECGGTHGWRFYFREIPNTGLLYWPFHTCDNFGNPLDFSYEINVTEFEPCAFSCPGGSIPEGEPECYDGYVDAYNGGCNAANPAFTTINNGDVICGKSGVFVRDSYLTPDDDWYKLIADDWYDITWKVVGEFDLITVIYEVESECDIYGVTSDYAIICDTAVINLETYPGTKYFRIRPSNANNPDCSNEYAAMLNMTPITPHYLDICFENQPSDCHGLYIANVTFGDINNESGREDEPCYYGDYTTLSTDVNPENDYQLSVTVLNSFGSNISAWIDWNQNLIFEEAEWIEVIDMENSGTFSCNVHIPTDATQGTTRMRVAAYDYFRDLPYGPNQCGEAEDYSINVLEYRQPEITVAPTELSESSTGGNVVTPILAVSNTGETGSLLRFTTSVTMDQPAISPLLSRAAEIDPKSSIIYKSSRSEGNPIQSSEDGLILEGGDNIADATVIPFLPFIDIGNTGSATDDYDGDCGYDGGAPDVVYSYTPDEDIWLNLDLYYNGLLDYDSRMYIYENDETSSTIACSDNYSGNGSIIMGIFLTVGNTYYIIIDGANGESGNYCIYVDEIDEPEGCWFNEDVIISQPPSIPGHDYIFLSSDKHDGYKIYDNIFVMGEITGLWWWGSDVTEGWECTEPGTVNFEITYYQDNNGMPGTPVQVDTFAVTPVPTGDLFPPGIVQNKYVVEYDTPIQLWGNYWISIQDIQVNDCSFYFQLNYWDEYGECIRYVYDTGNYSVYGANASICVFGEMAPSWLTVSSEEGRVHYGDPALNVPVTMNPSGLASGTYHGSVNFATNDPNNSYVNIPVTFNVAAGYNYLPGDANMNAGIWPPSTIGGDVTYLVNYFRGITPACMLDGFYASADANGDCNISGADVTKMVNYFRGLAQLQYCVDYPPAWPPIPDDTPSGWPNCGSSGILNK